MVLDQKLYYENILWSARVKFNNTMGEGIKGGDYKTSNR